MKLLTLNTHSLIEPDYEAKREFFVNFIAAEQPEVFALQEVNQTAAGGRSGGVLSLPRQYSAAESGQPRRSGDRKSTRLNSSHNA